MTPEDIKNKAKEYAQGHDFPELEEFWCSLSVEDRRNMFRETKFEEIYEAIPNGDLSLALPFFCGPFRCRVSYGGLPEREIAGYFMQRILFLNDPRLMQQAVDALEDIDGDLFFRVFMSGKEECVRVFILSRHMENSLVPAALKWTCQSSKDTVKSVDRVFLSLEPTRQKFLLSLWSREKEFQEILPYFEGLRALTEKEFFQSNLTHNKHPEKTLKKI